MDLHKWQESKMDLGTYVQGLVTEIREVITQFHCSLTNACFSVMSLPAGKKSHISVTKHVHKQLHLEKMISL